ncbi:MAG: MFS transporter [Candidatus Marinimicrobia bacterium]|nr:MFS transporter [Candidatus Neomarinimicrobiota bacterium]
MEYKINVPYSTLMGVMTPNSLEQTQLSTYRFVAAFIGGLIVQISPIDLVKSLGGGNEQLEILKIRHNIHGNRFYSNYLRCDAGIDLLKIFK